MAEFPVTKTADHTTLVGNLYGKQDSGSDWIMPTFLVTADLAEVNATNPIPVTPGTGASWAVTGPLTDTGDGCRDGDKTGCADSSSRDDCRCSLNGQDAGRRDFVGAANDGRDEHKARHDYRVAIVH
jgi:hypothetical protein